MWFNHAVEGIVYLYTMIIICSVLYLFILYCHLFFSHLAIQSTTPQTMVFWSIQPSAWNNLMLAAICSSIR